ncbi:MAG: glycogen synthase GlgA [Verrucomicrobiae bacterium]|nr:glycogen synthase GlgA [Verrucomicrobiae bacterium]
MGKKKKHKKEDGDKAAKKARQAGGKSRKPAGKTVSKPAKPSRKMRKQAEPDLESPRPVSPVTRKGTRPRAKTASAPAKAGGALRILFVASECTPFAKIGGLADAVAALPKALIRLGHDVRILMPLYRGVDREKHRIRFRSSVCVHMGQGEENWVGLHETLLEDTVPVYFIEHDRFYGRAGIYDDWEWGEYGDNAFRFALLCKSALQVCKDLDFIPHVLHGHDWPGALCGAFLKTWDRVLSPLSQTASVLTIHNIGHQGVYHASVFPYLGLGGDYFHPGVIEDHGKVNLLKAGVFFADAITTVSPTYKEEIKTPLGGQGLAPFLNGRHEDFFGVLNGVDYEHWDPATDPLLPARYSGEDLRGKARCKFALQERMGLARDAEAPIFGVVSRFARQKGFDLLKEALPRALQDMHCQVVVLGQGDPATEDFFRWLVQTYPGKAGAQIGFSNETAHLIEAGSDFFLMPSLYEPCGLNQMYSLKYGTLPVVRATGGLEDTVVNYNESTGEGTGFKFYEPSGMAVYYTMGWAVSTWFDRPQHIDRMRAAAMAQDFGWHKPAAQYEKVYRHALEKRKKW